MRIRIGMLAIILELGLLSCSHIVMAQYPSQRFGKVTASQVETGALTMSGGAGAGKVLTSDGSGNALWQSPSGPVDVGWHATSDGNNITSLYRQLVVGGPTLGTERLLVQGFIGWGYGADLIEPSYWNTDGTFCFASSAKASAAFDNTIGATWMPTDSAPWVALKFTDGAHQVNRVKLFKYRDDEGQGVIRFPWDRFAVYGSNDSTNGVDGAWTAISPLFTVQHVSESSHCYDFPENTKSYGWIKLAGTRSTQTGNLWLHEVEASTYSPVLAKRFWVDGTGNPITDGTMTAAALTLTTNSLTATLTPTDIMNVKNEVWSWIDGSNATAKKTRLNVGRQSAGSEMFFVQGYAPAPVWVDVSPTLTGDDQSVMNMLPVSRSPWVYIISDGSSNPSQNIDLVHTVLPSGHDGIRINTKLPVASVVNRMSIYKTGYGGTLAFDNMMVYGSSDSTNGTDGNWTLVAGPFTPTAPQRASANVWVNWDFMANAASYKWIRLEGDYNATYAGGLDYWTELRWFSYQTPAANATWVDGQGNPGTSGCLTAASITLTTNSQIASFGIADVQSWKSNPWALADDGQNITGRYKNVVLGSTASGTERLKVIGFQGSGFSTNQARLAGMSYYSISNATNQSWFEPPTSFDGTIAAANGGSGNGWAPGAGNPVWLAFKYQAGTSKVLNKFTMWREGDSSIPFASYSVYGSNNTTNGADGTWELVAGPFLPTIGGGQYYQTLSEDALFLDNKKSFNAYKIMGPVRGGRVLELEAYTYAPTPDKTFYVDAQGNPGTDGKMTAGTLRFMPLAAAPDSPQPGTAYFDSTIGKLRVWDGSAWQNAW